MEERPTQPQVTVQQANMPAAGMMELFSALRGLEAQVQALRTDVTELKAASTYSSKAMEALTTLTEQNKTLIYGDTENPERGLIVRVDRLERAMNLGKWLIVTIVVPIIGILVSALLHLIVIK